MGRIQAIQGIFLEQPGVISENEIYVAFGNTRIFTGDTYWECVKEILLHWEDERYLVG